MASFKAILKTILGVEQAVAPALEVIYPPLRVIDPLIQRIIGGITTAEQQITSPGSGAQKFAQVLGDFDTFFSVANDALAISGQRLVYDAAAFKTANDAFVAAFNQAAALKGSIKVEKI